MRFLLETLALTAVMAAPYFLLDYGWAFLVGFLAAIGSDLWPALAIERKDRDLPRRPTKVMLLDMGFLQSVPLMILAVTAAAVTGWLDWAYRIDVVPQYSLRMVWLISGILFLVPLLHLALARPLGKGGAANEFLAGVRSKGFVHFHAFWLSGAALGFAIICLFVFHLVVRAASFLTTVMNDSEVPSFWQLVTAFPLLPLGLVASAGFLALARVLSRSSLSGRAAYRAYISDAGDSPTPAKNTNALAGVAVLCGWGITLFVVLYPLHLASVMATSSIAGLELLSETLQAVERWTDEQRASGRTSLQMAQVLDEHGHWNADAPEIGLPELFPELKDALLREDGSGIGNCHVTVAAGAIPPTLAHDVDWREGRQAQSDLRYCLRVACPSPAVWDAPAPVVLYSSQASQNEQWTRNLFFDVLAKGRAAAPGGNCTAVGELADRFQG